MKKLMFLGVLFFCFALGNYAQYQQTIPMTGFTTDTTLWVKFQSKEPISIQFDYPTITADSLVIDVGMSNDNDKSDWLPLDYMFELPYTCDTAAANPSLIIIKGNWNTYYMIYRIRKTGVSAITGSVQVTAINK